MPLVHDYVLPCVLWWGLFMLYNSTLEQAQAQHGKTIHHYMYVVMTWHQNTNDLTRQNSVWAKERKRKIVVVCYRCMTWLFVLRVESVCVEERQQTPSVNNKQKHGFSL